MARDVVIIDISAGETVLVDWSMDMCEKSCNAIVDRIGNIDPTMRTSRGSVESNGGKVEVTRGRRARSPKGHRIAYRIRASSFGRDDADMVKLIKRAKDAGKV